MTLPETLLHEVREMGINVPHACERGLTTASSDTRRKRWLEENREAIEAWNEHLVKNDLPLAGYRLPGF